MKENNGFITKIQHYKNMPELIAEALKEGILQGKYKGGVQLKQDEIAKQFDVSLIPVREALIQLEARGLVKSVRNKGMIVAPLSIDEMKMLFEVRQMLEIGAVPLILKRITPEEFEKLRYIIEKMEQKNDIYETNRYNTLFHEVLCNAAHNPQLSKTYTSLFVRVERYLMYILKQSYDRELTACAHRELLELIENKEEQLLRSKISLHIEEACNHFISEMTKHKDLEVLDWNEFLPFT